MPTYHRANVRGHNLFYREAGFKDSSTIVILRGFPSSSHMFRNLILQPANKFHVIVLVLVLATCSGSRAQSSPAHRTGGIDTGETREAKIERAMSAGPSEIARSAKIIDKDQQGQTVVLRQGSNGFTCMPGNPNVIGDPPMCADGPSMQWAADFAAHKARPTNTAPGITYMLAGATQRSDSDPRDQASPGITVGPHWMIMWPFDPKATGLPSTHSDTGAYIMWAGTPWAHVHVMGRPEGNQ